MMLHPMMMLHVVTIDFLVHMHLDPKEISWFYFIEFNSNFSGFAVYGAGVLTTLVSSDN